MQRTVRYLHRSKQGGLVFVRLIDGAQGSLRCHVSLRTV